LSITSSPNTNCIEEPKTRGWEGSSPSTTTNISPISKGSQSTADRGSGQAYNLTAKKAKTFKEVIIGKITVYSKPVLALFDFGVSYCYISDSFIALHSIPIVCLNN